MQMLKMGIIGRKRGGGGINLGPGSQELIAGDMTAGFFGEVTTTEFGADHADLYTLIGLTDGTLQNQTEPLLKFIHDGKIKFIPKKSTRNATSWNAINVALGGSSGGSPAEKTITVGDNQYNVRFMRGVGRTQIVSDRIATNVYSDVDGASIWSSTDNGVTGNWNALSPNEWNTLILPLHTESDGGGANKNNFAAPADAPDYVPDWASYTDEDLNVRDSGSYVWCAETRDDSTSRRMLRGYNSSSLLFNRVASDSTSYYGCRLVFELVTE